LGNPKPSSIEPRHLGDNLGGVAEVAAALGVRFGQKVLNQPVGLGFRV